MATVASLERNAQLKIRDLICEDPLALHKWALVVDDVVSSAVDVRKIKSGLKEHDYEEAILRTLQLCSWDLVGVLRRHGLNSVAEKIATVLSGSKAGLGRKGTPNYSLNQIWHDVGELPHGFSGRGSEVETTHQRLSHHSNRSVDANIVCISGPAGCGKSTFARQYAFDKYDSYDGNVVWIDAESTESMRASFTKLAKIKLRLPANEDNQTLAEDVYDFFKDRKCLFVFDGLQRMEDFNQFRPKIISPRYSTPYLLVTNREDGLAPEEENEVRILHYRVVVLQTIEREDKSAAELAKLISYLDPGKVTVRFLEEMFGQMKKSGRDFQSCLRLLEKHKLVELSDSRVVIEPGVQEIIRWDFPEGEALALPKLKETYRHLLKKSTKDLLDECTAHRLHLLHFHLISISLIGYIQALLFDVFRHSDKSSLLNISLQAYEILKNRLGEGKLETIYARIRVADAHCRMKNYPEAIGILESLLPVAKDHDDWTTGEILELLVQAYLKSGDRERANQYKKELEAYEENVREEARKLGAIF